MTTRKVYQIRQVRLHPATPADSGLRSYRVQILIAGEYVELKDHQMEPGDRVRDTDIANSGYRYWVAMRQNAMVWRLQRDTSTPDFASIMSTSFIPSGNTNSSPSISSSGTLQYGVLDLIHRVIYSKDQFEVFDRGEPVYNFI